MDNQRFFLWAALAFVLYLIYQQWQADYAPRPEPTTVASVEQRADGDGEPLDDPTLPDAVATDDGTVPDVPAVEETETREPTGQRVTLVSDVLRLEIDTLGGAVVVADLLEYPVTKDQPDKPVRLFNDEPGNRYVLQTGMRAVDGGPEPTHRVAFETDATQVVMGEGEDTIELVLSWRDGDRLVQKIFALTRGSYAVDVSWRVRNDGADAWRLVPYMQLQHQVVAGERSMFDVETYSYQGPVVYDGDGYEKLDDLDDGDFRTTVTGGWAAILQHYFVSAIVPVREAEVLYEARLIDGSRYLVRGVGPTVSVEPGATARRDQRFWVGPKLQDQMETVADGLDLTVDYGFLHIISKPLFVVLAWIHSLVGNWGWSIIILTMLIKLAFYKLSETSGRSMARMRKMQPRLKAIQERYKDDREKLNQAMMKLYREEKINPAAGCLPILVQIPVFLALYWVLLESVELRHAPFMLWLQDLSSRDPYYVLPVLMGLSMLIQQKLNPAPPDPVQAKIMMILPVVFSFFFAFFPSGLVLYWFTNNLLTIAQQWRINTLVEAEK